MRKIIAAIGALAGSPLISPAAAFEPERRDMAAHMASFTRDAQPVPERRAGRTVAAFEIGEQAISLAAYGRRARARAMGDAAEIRQARAMGKVFDGAPQPALLTFEVRLHF